MATQRITELFKTTYPIIQAGMVWCSGWRLASAVSQAGGLGLIGAGSMHPDTLRYHIQRCKESVSVYGVNVPLLYPEIKTLMEIIVEEHVPIVFTSAGNPALWTGFLKEKEITVVHVVSSVKFARKSAEAGVDAVVAEGFEAGGHNGREETTTFCLIPMVRDAIDIPLIAAGGIATGKSMLAAEALGAEGFQIGTRFAASVESSAHIHFKERITKLKEGDTVLTLKQLTPVRLIKNKFYEQIAAAESGGASSQQLLELLGKGRAKKGIFEGDLDEGELEIGQIAASIKEILPAGNILKLLWEEYESTKKHLCQ